MPPIDPTDHQEVVPAARGCAVLISAAACGMVLLTTLVLGVVQLIIAPRVEASLESRNASAPGLTDFIFSIPWWLAVVIGLVVAGFAVIKELAISHALANFIINVLILTLLLGYGVVAAVGLISPYIQ